MLAEQADRQEQEIVEVDGRRLVEPALVLGVDAREPRLVRADGLGRQLVGEDEVVLERGDARVELTGREPLRIEIEIAADPVDETDGVGLVVDRELRPVPEQRGLAAQDARARGVERGDPHPPGDAADQRRDAVLHLGRGLVGEGDRQDRERRRVAIADQVREPVGEHAGLARAGAGDHEDGAHRQRDRLPLRRIEALEIEVTNAPRRAVGGRGFGRGSARRGVEQRARGVTHDAAHRTGALRHQPAHTFGSDGSVRRLVNECLLRASNDQRAIVTRPGTSPP